MKKIIIFYTVSDKSICVPSLYRSVSLCRSRALTANITLDTDSLNNSPPKKKSSRVSLYVRNALKIISQLRGAYRGGWRRCAWRSLCIYDEDIRACWTVSWRTNCAYIFKSDTRQLIRALLIFTYCPRPQHERKRFIICICFYQLKLSRRIAALFAHCIYWLCRQEH